MRQLLLALCLLLSLPGQAQPTTPPDNASQRFAATLAEITTLTGKFQQRHYDETGALLSESRGQFQLLRPAHFLWDISAPDSQLVVADPRYVWHYDRDLATVTRRPASTDGQMSPLQILGGGQAQLNERFDVSSPAAGQYVLRPRTPDLGFEQVTVLLSGERITGMEILDDLRQRIAIEFSDVVAGQPLTSEDFDFEPPEGVDVFYHDD